MNLDMQLKRGLLALAMIAGTGAVALTAPKPVCQMAQDGSHRSFIVSPAQIHPLVLIDAVEHVRVALSDANATSNVAHELLALDRARAALDAKRDELIAAQHAHEAIAASTTL